MDLGGIGWGAWFQRGTVAGSYEHGNELWFPINGGEFLD